MSGKVAVEVRYGVDWDTRAGKLLHPLTEAEARTRDADGKPFVVELRGKGGRVQTVVRSCPAQGIVHVLAVGELGAVDREYQYVELWQDRLHLRRFRDYRQPDVIAAESGASPCFEADIAPTGRARLDVHGSDGGLFQTQSGVPDQCRTLARPPFGDWTAYLEDPAVVDVPDCDAAPCTDDEDPGRAMRWPGWAEHPGLRPRHLQALFTVGARLEDQHYGIAEIQEPEVAGILRLPTGRVIAADPATLHDGDEPFTVTVPSGNYRVLIGHMTWEGKEWGEVTAAKVEILPDSPTVGWELALRPGQDPRLLGENEFYGFGVDAGTGCFLDAAIRHAFTEDSDQQIALCEFDDASYSSWTDPATGGTVIAYPSGMGDGSYPVWIGRDADGQVTCLIADMLILNSAAPVPPTVEDSIPYHLPEATLPVPQGAPVCGAFGAATAHLAQLRADTVAMAERIRAQRPWH